MASQIPGYYTVEEAAKAMKRSPSTVYHFLNTKQIPCRRVGQIILIEQADVHNFQPKPKGNPNFRKISDDHK